VHLRALVCWDCAFESRRGTHVCLEYRVLSGSGRLITGPKESYRVCVSNWMWS